jgi:hypothetical protein
MSKERYNQIIDEVYKNYEKQYSTFEIGIVKSIAGNNPMVDSLLKNNSSILSQQEFINKIKTDQEFSEKWGLKIEERELSLEERMQIWNERIKGLFIMLIWGHDKTQEESLNEHNIPNKLITLTYQDESIQFYE